MLMQFPKLLRSTVARVMMGAMLLVSGLAQAAPVSTTSLLDRENAASVNADRARLMTLVQREDVAKQLSALGVDPANAQKRVADMSPAEVAQLNQRIDSLPAGSGILGVAVLIFIVFIITDAIGATDVFTFVHPVR